MQRRKAILLYGLARGGTNIVWNLLQSHPAIVSTVYELGQLMGRKSSTRLADQINLLRYKVPATHAGSVRYFQDKFDAFVLQTLTHEDNRYKHEGQLYTEQEVRRATCCFKGVASPRVWDLKYDALLGSCYDEVYRIGLIRNGFSVCEGWLRRGVSARQAGRYYSRFAEQLQRMQAHYQSFKIVSFEEVLADPFGAATDLFRFVQETPYELDRLRLKVKKTLSSQGAHEVRYGQENRKYWFDRERISALFDPTVDHKQRAHLSDADAAAFERAAGGALRYFGYL